MGLSLAGILFIYACAACGYRVTGMVLGLPLAVYGLWREIFDNGRLI